MMPLTMCKAGEENEIKKIGGKEETRRHLENLGFVVGGKVAVISETDGNMIVNVKSTICIGLAASMGAFLLAGGTKGKRFALPNSEIMIHQPSGGAKGQATEIQIAAENILKTKKRLNEILAANTGKPYETIAADTERDNYMSAQEAADYGLIDGVITNR